MTSAFVARQEVRDKIEEQLDKALPAAQRRQTWGVELTPEEWERLKAGSKLA